MKKIKKFNLRKKDRRFDSLLISINEIFLLVLEEERDLKFQKKINNWNFIHRQNEHVHVYYYYGADDNHSLDIQVCVLIDQELDLQTLNSR